MSFGDDTLDTSNIPLPIKHHLIGVLDHGFVSLVNSMGSDIDICVLLESATTPIGAVSQKLLTGLAPHFRARMRNLLVTCYVTNILALLSLWYLLLKLNVLSL